MAVIDDGPTVALDNILFATDFTSASEKAGVWAKAFAKRFSSKLTVANVVDLSVATKSDEAVTGIPIDELRQECAENLEHAANDFASSGIRVLQRSVEAHHPASAAVRMAEESKADMLIIGTHAREGLNRFMLGSFAERVIHQARCPVLTVGPNAGVPNGDVISFGTILFATDLAHKTAEKAAVALSFAQDSCARILLIHVLEHPASKLIDSLDQQLKAEGELMRLVPDAVYEWCRPECEVEYGRAAAEILRLAEQVGVDLIVLGAQRKKVWFFKPEGVAAKVIHKAKCPVLTICD